MNYRAHSEDITCIYHEYCVSIISKKLGVQNDPCRKYYHSDDDDVS